MQQGIPQKNGLGTAGFILSLIGICTFWLLTYISMILGVIGLILGAIAYWGKWKDAKLGLAGFIMGLITIIVTIVYIIIIISWATSVVYG